MTCVLELEAVHGVIFHPGVHGHCGLRLRAAPHAQTCPLGCGGFVEGQRHLHSRHAAEFHLPVLQLCVFTALDLRPREEP